VTDDTEQYVRFQMTWPAWLDSQVKDVAKGRTISAAAWLREAALEKLEREGKERP